MPIEFRERTNSPVIVDNLDSADRVEQRFYAVGSDVAADVYAAALADLPTEYLDLPRKDITLEWNGDESLWEVVVVYQVPGFGDGNQGDVVTTFDTTGGTFRRLQSISTTARYPANAPSFERAINVNGDSIDGVDLISPAYQFSETHYKPDSFVSNAYRALLMLYTGRVNSDTFRSFGTGQVLFAGVSGTRDAAKAQWTLTYQFIVSPNAANIDIGNGIVVAFKKGWEYLWVRYESQEDTAAKKLVRRPIAAYVERVYEESPFSALGL